MTDTDVIRRLPAQPSTTDLNLWLVSRLKGEGSELTFGQIASIAKDLSAALRSPGGDGELVDLLVSELDRARNQIARMDHDERCFTNDPNEDACCCICGKDSALTMIDDALERAALSKAEATSAPTPAPVSGERERCVVCGEPRLLVCGECVKAQYADALRTPHGLPGGMDGVRSVIAMLREVASARVKKDSPHTIKLSDGSVINGEGADLVVALMDCMEAAASKLETSILSRLSPASREDVKNG